ncbi:conserved hypothetical protein [Leishmania mexicana MHOM/GT/2001/U1103]|uniref:C2HC/C3H-type domain-containing protein n=1 Tax=Leishmania mexicana (strain MHOM/GT/2001/U1103) TaxID=929439 RepID=E9AKJ1_LEIMU|nr:conserved hypothetical protein [Leishmania mexicana MHOM/GT/2001/U1103]CBZ23442.1 conserved hypothetical protein [Leishmania mexicana MHOM/GT/2001/U1103]
MPAGANSRTPATDFVQDYAAKRQAQMERARQLREDRLQQQQQRQPSPKKSGGGGGTAYNSSPAYTAVPSPSSGGTTTAAPTSRQPPPPSLHVPRSSHVTPGHGSATSGSSPGKCGDGCVLYVKEQDFKQATQAGIITPDQARQLWAMLSNQIIRVCSPSAHANAVSVSSLLALSNNSCNSSGRAAGGPQSAGGSEFGASISLESLRTSIAYFKREQQRLHQQGGGGAAGAAPGSTPQGHHPLSSSPPALSNTAGQPLSQSRGASQRQLQYDGTDSNDTEQRTLGAPMPLRGGGGGGGGRPAWNSDVEVHHEDNFDDKRSSGAAALKKPRTGRTNTVRPAAKGPAAPLSPASGASGVFGTSAQGGGYGNHGEEAGNNVYMPPQPSSGVPRGAKTGGSAATGRRLPASRPTAPPPSSGAPVNLDEVPVGGGGGGGMNDWANAYPPGMVPPTSISGNDAIAAEAAAAAQEPMQECRTCGRGFRISVVVRHEALCRNQANKPRKVFNMREQRLDGVEGIKEVQRTVARSGGVGGGRGVGGGGGRGGGGDAAAAGAAKGKLPKWKVQHEQFQAAMRAVRQQKEAGGGFGSGRLAPPPAPIPEEYDDRVPCPHCGRKFAQEVAARHIPKCATTIAKPKGIRPIRR